MPQIIVDRQHVLACLIILVLDHLVGAVHIPWAHALHQLPGLVHRVLRRVEGGEIILRVISEGHIWHRLAHLKGIVELKKKQKVRVIAQNEESCTVYGMPRSIVDGGLADDVVPLSRVADQIIKNVGVC